MDFNLIEAGKLTSDSSSMHFSGAGGPIFTAAPPPLMNGYPCTSLSLMQRRESMEAMRETIFRMAVMQPVHVEAEAAPRRKNVRISTDPQSVAARHRRERISHRIRTLQRMVPGGSKMDTASMLDEAVHYLKFLKRQVELLQQVGESNRRGCWNNISNANYNYANL